jgi:hypothetical protein
MGAITPVAIEIIPILLKNSAAILIRSLKTRSETIGTSAHRGSCIISAVCGGGGVARFFGVKAFFDQSGKGDPIAFVMASMPAAPRQEGECKAVAGVIRLTAG